LSRDVPELLVPPDLEMIGKRLRDQSFPIRWFTSQFHETLQATTHPPIPPAVFEQDVIRKLEAYQEEELRGWMKKGRGPIKEAARLAPDLPAPRGLGRVLDKLLERPRLAGAE